ncbi:MAG: LysR family transcriptional regulator [Clostridiales bacterium]|nr:LysR family transcriptional regulator [Clostridiales bacterium]
MAVTYDYYRIFYYVAKYQSFTQAAKVLLNSQPNITRAMNNLEQELGCRLFLRSHRGVTLTPEGELLFARVNVAQEQLQLGEEELTSAKSLRSGSISIGCSEIALHGLLLQVLQRFQKKYPDVRLHISNQSTTQALAAIKNSLVELAVVAMPLRTEVKPPLRVTKLRRFQEILVGGPRFAALAAQKMNLDEIANYPLILHDKDTWSYDFYNRLFAEHGLALRPDIEVATTDQILLMVEHDLGIGFLPAFFVQEAIARGTVYEIPLKEPVPERCICLVHDHSRPRGSVVMKMEEMLMEGTAADVVEVAEEAAVRSCNRGFFA